MPLLRRLSPVIAVAVLGACGSASSAEPPSTTPRTAPARSAESTTTAAATTSEAPAATTAEATTTTTGVPVSPLTGLPIDPGMLGRPAVIVKVDNHPDAGAPAGLADADLVVEEEVEGISRFAAVFWSQLPAQVGPVRSARSTDVDALSFLGNPALAFSGANARVLREVSRGPFVEFTEGEPAGAWRRERGRKAPHNLFVSPAAVAAAAAGRANAPASGFTFGAPTSGLPGGQVNVHLASTTSTWSWNGSVYTHTRDGAPHRDANGLPITATSVVVAFVPYARSSADRRSPEALSIGWGTAWVLTAGTFTDARWVRPSADSPWTLVTPDHNPVPLAPGKVALILARDGSATLQ